MENVAGSRLDDESMRTDEKKYKQRGILQPIFYEKNRVCSRGRWKKAKETRRFRSIRLDFVADCIETLLTRYAGDKFERSQHAYRTQRAQIHIQVYALRERRDEPAPKHTHPATLYYLLLYYTNAHAT